MPAFTHKLTATESTDIGRKINSTRYKTILDARKTKNISILQTIYTTLTLSPLFFHYIFGKKHLWSKIRLAIKMYILSTECTHSSSLATAANSFMIHSTSFEKSLVTAGESTAAENCPSSNNGPSYLCKSKNNNVT